jgi:hypothetical protein
MLFQRLFLENYYSQFHENLIDGLRRIHTQYAVPMPCPCRAHAVPLPCRALIHTRHAAPLPYSESAVFYVEVRVVAGNIRTASPIV